MLVCSVRHTQSVLHTAVVVQERRRFGAIASEREEKETNIRQADRDFV